MKQWPTDPMQTALDLVDPVREAVRRVRGGKPAAYDGFDIGSPEKCTAQSPDEALEKRDGRDLTESALWVALQLGVEQGRRLHRREVYSMLRRLIVEAHAAGVDVSWAEEQWTEETGKLWPVRMVNK